MTKAEAFTVLDKYFEGDAHVHCCAWQTLREDLCAANQERGQKSFPSCRKLLAEWLADTKNSEVANEYRRQYDAELWEIDQATKILAAQQAAGLTGR